jgi:uncharacterized protein (TIGR00369 family)
MRDNNITQEQAENKLKSMVKWQNDGDPGALTTMLKPRFESFDLKKLTLTCSFLTEDWSRNPNGVVHGGIIASMLDTVMGTLSTWNSGTVPTPTVMLQVSYIRPVPLNTRVYIRAHITNTGRTLSHTTGDAWLESAPGKTVATAVGSYFVTE